MKTLGVFAHPDDEAFGPAGTIARWAKEDEVYLVCLTDGNDAGVDKDLTLIRKDELEASAVTLGVKKVYFFGYPDGSLSHGNYHEIAERLFNLVDQLGIERLLTFEMKGVSGHLDHIAAAMVSSYVYKERRSLAEIWYSGITKDFRAQMGDYFIYFPEGYQRESFDEVIDISQEWGLKEAAIKKHQSQAKDVENMLEHFGKLPKEEYFFVKRR